MREIGSSCRKPLSSGQRRSIVSPSGKCCPFPFSVKLFILSKFMSDPFLKKTAIQCCYFSYTMVVGETRERLVTKYKTFCRRKSWNQIKTCLSIPTAVPFYGLKNATLLRRQRQRSRIYSSKANFVLCILCFPYSIYYIVHLWLRLIVVSAFVIDNLVSAYSNIYNSNDHAALL